MTATPKTVELAAAIRAHSDATYLMLYRADERARIEAAHDERPELIHRGQRTAQWYQAVADALRARAAEVNAVVETMRPGDEVRHADQPDGPVWTIRNFHIGSDGGIWVGLRRTDEDGAEVWSGGRACSYDLVRPATDEEHLAEVERGLDGDLRQRLITTDQHQAALEQARRGLAAMHPDSRACAPCRDAMPEQFAKFPTVCQHLTAAEV